MPSVKKIIEKMKNQPRGVRLEEAEKVLAAYGYSFKRQKGSHKNYLNEHGNLITLKDPQKYLMLTKYLNESERSKEKIYVCK